MVNPSPGSSWDSVPDGIVIRSVTPPQSPSRWSVTLPHPGGGRIDRGAPTGASIVGVRYTDDQIDAWAAGLAWPAGWEPIGTIQCTDRQDLRTVRVTLMPSAWASARLPAPIEAIAVAQVAGIPTALDRWVTASYGRLQYHDPDGRPTCCVCGWWHHALPHAIRAAVDAISDVQRRQSIPRGYMHGRPDTGRAAEAASVEAKADMDRVRQCYRTIREWIAAEHPSLLAS